ncbi:MAG: DNA mismatch repair protein MutS [Planctomycetota bacterium]
MTELMKQYLAIKKNHPDEILFFRLGDFYEMFFDDAKTAARILGITLTARFKDDKRVPMAGVPYHSATTYINRLLKAGYRVAICEQSQPAETADGLVDRSVVRIITPGTLLEEGLIQGKQHNFLCAINIDIKAGLAGISWVDLSIGKFIAADLPLTNLIDALRRINPSECLVPEYLDYDSHAKNSSAVSDKGALSLDPEGSWDKNPYGQPTIPGSPTGGSSSNSLTLKLPEYSSLLTSMKSLIPASFTLRPAWVFERTTAYKTLTEHFQTINLKGFGCDEMNLAIGSSGAIIDYLHANYPLDKDSALKHIIKMEKYSSDGKLYLDYTTIASLELVAAGRANAFGKNHIEGSLLGVLDKTLTPMGARLLKEWIISPLVNPDEIIYRQNGVKSFVNNTGLRQECIKHLKTAIGGYDIERYTARIGSSRANARDLTALKNTLSAIPQVNSLLSSVDTKIIKDIIKNLDDIPEFQKQVNDAIMEEPPIEITEGGIIKEGFNQDLDKIRNLASEGKEWIAKFQADEIKRTGINSLKVGYNLVFGYYIEITNVHSHKIPPNYTRKQTLKNAERYITPELKDYETQVLNATERSRKIEYEIFVGIRRSLEKHIGRLQETARSIGLLDTLLSLAQVAVEGNYCAPVINNDLIIKITDGRHPVIERFVPDKFVPNDTLLDGRNNKILIITGPNMAGKSTYIRQVALIVLMAQMGGFVPARNAVIGVVDRIFTRIGSGDEIVQGASTFMVEMNETANILNNATGRSLIILDEVGRGTSTFDGLSISWAVTEYIHDRLMSRTLFATHYHELTDLSLTLPGVKNYHIEVKEWGEKIIFIRKILEGGTDKSYGIQVSRLAGLPKGVIDRAKEVLNDLEKRDLNTPVSMSHLSANTKQSRRNTVGADKESRGKQPRLF